MRVGDFSTGVGRLNEAIEMLQRSWETTRELWNDRTAQSYEETHLRTILEEVHGVLQATVRMSDVVQRARRDCEPE